MKGWVGSVFAVASKPQSCLSDPCQLLSPPQLVPSLYLHAQTTASRALFAAAFPTEMVCQVRTDCRLHPQYSHPYFHRCPSTRLQQQLRLLHLCMVDVAHQIGAAMVDTCSGQEIKTGRQADRQTG